MQVKWFKPWGWFYLPVALPGVLVFCLALAFCVHVFIAVDRRSHSVSDTIYGGFSVRGPLLPDGELGRSANWRGANSTDRCIE